MQTQEDTIAAVSQPRSHVIRRAARLARSLASRSDVQLMNLIASGDESALGELYDRHAGIAYGLALRVVRDPGLAEDAVQDGFLSVWRSAGSFDSQRGAPRNWLLTLVHRRAVDLVQRNQRYREQTYEQAPAPLAPSAAETAELNTERRKVQVALAALPAKQRTALELAYYGGYTQQEIATRLELPIGTVKGQIFHGLKRLRDLLLEPDASPQLVAMPRQVPTLGYF